MSRYRTQQRGHRDGLFCPMIRITDQGAAYCGALNCLPEQNGRFLLFRFYHVRHSEPSVPFISLTTLCRFMYYDHNQQLFQETEEIIKRIFSGV